MSCLPFLYCFYSNRLNNFHVTIEKKWYLTGLCFLPANSGIGYTPELDSALVFRDFYEVPFLQSKKIAIRIKIKTSTPLPKQRTWLIASPLFGSPAQCVVWKWKSKPAAVMRFPALRNQKARVSFAGCQLHSPNLFKATQQC